MRTKILILVMIRAVEQAAAGVLTLVLEGFLRMVEPVEPVARWIHIVEEF